MSVLTVTVLSTVGFGDITPKTEVAQLQLVTTVQMLVDLVVGVVVPLILTTASRGRARQSTPRSLDKRA